MKKIFSGRFPAMLLCFCLVLAFGSCVSPRPFVEADAYVATPPPGFARITQDALTGAWRNAEGAVFVFDDDLFRSNIYNEGKAGRYVINPVFDSYLLVFYSDLNAEAMADYGMRLFFDQTGNLEKRNLDSLFALLSEDRNTLVLGEATYNRVGN